MSYLILSDKSFGGSTLTYNGRVKIKRISARIIYKIHKSIYIVFFESYFKD